jgi:hypothetical protein
MVVKVGKISGYKKSLRRVTSKLFAFELMKEPATYRIWFVFGSFSGGGGRTSELLDWLSKAT